MARTSTIAKQIVKKSQKVETEKVSTDKDNFVSSGSTLLNLALTDMFDCGWQKGKMANLIGDSSAGKTFVTLTAFAEANMNNSFDNYKFIFDDAEHANEFDMEHLFGDEVAERIESPNDKVEDGNSETMEDFHDNLLMNIEKEQPFIYALDSFDALSTEADDEKIEEQRTARAKGREAKGSYGMAKAKKSSEILRHVVGKLKKTNSILLIISQTRENLTPGSFEKKTRSGGKALKFYATHEVWLALGGTIKAKERIIGVNCIVTIKKNKITGKRRTVEFPIYYDYGIDDITSCIEFLIKEGYWKKVGTKIDAQGFCGLEPSTMKAIINQIEDRGAEKKLQMLVAKAWKEIEDSLKLGRKSKYA